MIENREIPMYLIAHYNHPVTFCQGRHLFKHLNVPCYAYGIVGIAKYHHARMFNAEYSFKFVKIHAIFPIGIFHKPIVNDLPLIALGNKPERVINRLLYDHFIAFAGKVIYCKSQSFYHSGHICQFFPGENKPVHIARPVYNRLPITVGSARITIYAVF